MVASAFKDEKSEGMSELQTLIFSLSFREVCMITSVYRNLDGWLGQRGGLRASEGVFTWAHNGKGRCCFCLYARIAEKAIKSLIQLIVTSCHYLE